MSKTRILIIEDDPDVAAYEREVCERADFAVQIARNGEQGL